MESGLILKGWEVKSIRNKTVDISNGYLFFQNYEVYLIGLNIQPNQPLSNELNQKITRNIKILLKKKEIHTLYGKYKTKGYSLIALALYWKNAWCKLKIGVARGKSKQDKRLHIQKKEWNIQKNIIVKKILR